MVFWEDRAVIIDVLHGGYDEGVGLEPSRVQDRDVQEVPLGQSQATEDDQIPGGLLDLYDTLKDFITKQSSSAEWSLYWLTC